MGRKAALLICALSFACTMWIPILAKNGSGDLSGWYTDHLHNTYATWVFLHHGLEVYTEPFFQAQQGVPPFPHVDNGWGAMPIAYPPGVFVLFLPLTIVGHFFALTRAHFGLIGVLYLLFWAHCVFYAMLRLLDATGGRMRWLVATAFWLDLMFIALQGFFDIAYIGFGVLAMLALARQRPTQSLLWICVASLFHYRALCLVGLGVLALQEALRGRTIQQWPWRVILTMLITGAIVISTFLLVYDTAAHTKEAARPLIVRDDWRYAGAAITLGVATIGGYLGGRAVPAFAIGCFILTLVERQPYWWHSGCLLLLPLSVGLMKKPRAMAFMRIALVVLAAFIARKVWRAEYFSLPRELDKRFHLVDRAVAAYHGVPYIEPPPDPRRLRRPR